ncbi:MAG: 50S ribosomal protein L6 [Spirochaetota bacterium]|nr:50S ribosomal protein L6 [Spirochaetota bacterium]
MSRVGNNPIPIPNEVTITQDKNCLSVNGPLGKQSLDLLEGIGVEIKDSILYVIKDSDNGSKELRAKHGLSRALIANMITGVSKGFEKHLEIVGIGYRATQENKSVVFQLGYSHPINFEPPEGITIEVPQPTKILVKGVNKQEVGQVAANIRSLRPPEPYKGKGIRYKDEYIRRKAGKAGKK